LPSVRICNADVLLVAADAGLPDYNGGIHRIHPRLVEIGLDIYDASSHALFERNPALAWGHWTARQREYKNALPHTGYGILYAWSKCTIG
jgi:hypothetical protein